MAKPPGSVQTATISAGEKLSTPVDVTQGRISHIIVPADWDPVTNITFEASHDGTNYFEVRDNKGQEVMLAVTPGTLMLVDTLDLAGAHFKIRSGRHVEGGIDVAQTGDRTLIVAIAQ